MTVTYTTSTGTSTANVTLIPSPDISWVSTSSAAVDPAPAPPPDPDPNSTVGNEPALTKTTIAGVVAAVLLLIIARVNRSWEILNGSELDQAKALVALVAPFIAGFLIRRVVVPVAKADAGAKFFMAAGYAQGHEDGQATEIPDHVVASLKAAGVAEAKAASNARRAETRAANAKASGTKKATGKRR